MAEEKFSIIELIPSDDASGTQRTGVRFDWDRQTHTKPVDAWEMPVKLRTHRQDYPGTDEPDEQVLGPMFEPFTLNGDWKDRWAGAGYAMATWKAFEALAKRGNKCKFQHGPIEVVGLITDFVPKYRRKWDIGYSFTVSPHFREGQREQDRQQVQKASTPIVDHSERVQATVRTLKLIHTLAPIHAIKGTLHADVTAKLLDWTVRATSIARILESRTLFARGAGVAQIGSRSSVAGFAGSTVLGDTLSSIENTTDRPVNTVSRMLQAFDGLRASAASLLDVTRSVTTAQLFHADTMLEMSFDSWVKLMGAQARALVVQCYEAAQELRRRATPDAVALYRPRAGESLYSIQNKFGVNWRLIYDRNNLTNLELEGTEVLVIPGVR
jgi:hypothetical protein